MVEWRGPGKSVEVHGGLGREMERVVRSGEGWREPRRGGKCQGRLESAWEGWRGQGELKGAREGWRESESVGEVQAVWKRPERI